MARLRLLRSRNVGIKSYHRLMDEHGSAADALKALPAIARDAGVSDYASCPEDAARREVEAARMAGSTMLFLGEDAYPALLARLDDAPPILWAVGDTALLARPMVALVGARNASSLGLRMARRLATELGAAGHVVVSGLARGIDTAAHQAALPTGTVAVMGGGVDVAYPRENTVLCEEIGRSGLRLSEAPMGLVPQARHFPRRNRIVSGLAQAVIVVEAAAKSGSLITARTALDQGREVMAVPGHPFDPRAAGGNMLIRDGATLVRGTRDVEEALASVAGHAVATPAEDAPSPSPPLPENLTRALEAGAAARPPEEHFALHQQILSRLTEAPLAEDQLIRDLGAATGAVGQALVSLQLDGRIERQAGGLLARTGR